jgi:Glycosyl hydrolase family 79 C-terminal beta domain
VQKVIALNLEFFDSTNTRPAPRVVDVSDVLGQSVSVRRFTGVGSEATGNVTWAGQSFDTGFGDGSITVENYYKGQVSIGASEAVLIEIVNKAL